MDDTLSAAARPEAGKGVRDPQLNSSIADDVCRLTGVDEVKPLAALAADIREANLVYMLHAPAEGTSGVARHTVARASADRGRSVGLPAFHRSLVAPKR